MSQTTSLPDLALLTLRDPAAAARIVQQWHVPKEALWTAIALVTVLMTIMSTLSNMIFPVPEPLSGIVGSPFIYFIVAAGGFIATVLAVYWTGRMMGGHGEIRDLMVLLLWLQALRAASQVLVLVALLMAPVLASFLVIFIAAATLWIFVQFINVGMRLDSLWRAFFVLLIGATALIAGLSFLLSLIGISAVGVPLNV